MSNNIILIASNESSHTEELLKELPGKGDTDLLAQKIALRISALITQSHAEKLRKLAGTRQEILPVYQLDELQATTQEQFTETLHSILSFRNSDIVLYDKTLPTPLSATHQIDISQKGRRKELEAIIMPNGHHPAEHHEDE